MHKGVWHIINSEAEMEIIAKGIGKQQGTSTPVCESVVLSHLDSSSVFIHKGVVDLN